MPIVHHTYVNGLEVNGIEVDGIEVDDREMGGLEMDGLEKMTVRAVVDDKRSLIWSAYRSTS